MGTPTGPTAASAAMMTEGEAELWRRRLVEQSAATLRRRAERSAARQNAARRRAHGLIDRQAARLARARAAPVSPALNAGNEVGPTPCRTTR